MKYIIFFIIFLSAYACDDEHKAYLETIKNIKIENKSETKIWIQYFRYSRLYTEHELEIDSIRNFGLIKDSINNSHINLNCDSVYIVFSDNRKLVYRRNQCESKNILCESTYQCGTGPEPSFSYCKFTITPEDYKNAK